MDGINDDYTMKDFPLQRYENFYDELEFQDQCCSYDGEYCLINEKIEEEFGFYSDIKEDPKNPSDDVKNIKKPNPKSPKFESHCFFNPKLKDKEIIEKNRKQKKIIFLSRKTDRTERKRMKDNIIKKIKSRFFKSIKNILKEKIRLKYKYKKSFKYLPQEFICDISIENNKSFWEETLLEFFERKLESNNKALDLVKEDKIGEIKLKDLFNDYLNSQEFVDSIPSIDKEDNIDQNYIDDYINNAKEFINYFQQKKPRKKKTSSQ